MPKAYFFILFNLCSLFCLGQIDEVNSYDELLGYSGSADSVYVDHPRYYGLFVRGTCTETNFGTTFKTPSACWQRIHDNYSPRYWAIGGQSPARQISRVMKEVDAINSAAYTAWLAGGDTLEINGMYQLDGAVWLLEKNTYLGMTDSSGFVREDPPKTVLTHTARVNDRKIIVKDNSGFRSFQKINIANAQNYDSLAGFVSYNAFISKELGGDTTIFLSGRSVRETMLPGDSVSLFFPIMQGVSWAKADDIQIQNLVFDGNRKHYTLNYDWRVNQTILFPTNSGSVIDKCRFYNITSENIALCGTKVTNCSGTGFNGSALHFSCSAKGTPTEVLYNSFSRLNEVGNDVMKHSEAALTFSSKVRNFRISYNQITDANEIGIGLFSNDDTTNVITDNLIETSGTEIGYRPFYKYDTTNLIYNNKNPAKAIASTGSCFLAEPTPIGTSPCTAGSSLDRPLQPGDLINIPLDSLYMLNSNENYVKGIFIDYNNEYFELAGVGIINPRKASTHNWSFETYNDQQGIVFDNGHKTGIYGEGNWGYEPCGKAGGCKNLKIFFRVTKLPEVASTVPCPLKGLRVVYDGDLDTWTSPVLCKNKSVTFNQDLLGQPVLSGSQNCAPPTGLISETISQTTVDLEWQGVENASLYLFWYKQKGDAKWKKVLVKDVLSKRLSGLKSSVNYVWTVQARCGEHWGERSPQETFIIEPTDCKETSFKEIVANPVLTNRVRLNWRRTETYRNNIRWRLEGTDNWTSKSFRSDFRFWINNLSPNSTYEYQIRAVCNNGTTLSTSQWSEIKTFTTAILINAEAPPKNAYVPITGKKLEVLEPETGLRVIPNPAKNEIQLYTLSLELQSAQVVNTAGKVLIEQKFKTGSPYHILVSDLPKGLYVIKILSTQGMLSKKLIIE